MSYNPAIPGAADLISTSQSQIQTNFSQLDTVFDVDHYKYSAASNNGLHKKATLIEQAVAPAALADAGIIYAADDGVGNTEVYLRRSTPALTLALTFVKAWGVFNGTTGALISGYNCATARTAAGSYTVTFTVALPNANYGVVTGTQMVAAFSSGGTVGTNNLAVGGFNIYVRALTGNFGTDLSQVSFIVFG